MPGEAVGLAEALGDGVAFGLVDGAGAGVGVATEAMMVFGGGLAAPSLDPDLSEPFGNAVFVAAFRATGDGVLTGLAGVLVEFAGGFVRAVSRLPAFDPAAGARVAPGELKTTSSLFERCSTCAVVPG
jgi:hypothetical protein